MLAPWSVQVLLMSALHAPPSSAARVLTLSVCNVCFVQMRGKFAELLAMDTAQLGDLRECLHNLVVDYNSSQSNPRCAMTCGAAACFIDCLQLRSWTS